jgi:hypothetical protein
VLVQSVGTRLFPEGYISALTTHLDEPATMLGVRRFNHLTLASNLVKQAKIDLATQISVRDYHTAEQVAKILGVGIMTVHNWRSNGALPFEAQTILTDRHSQKGRQVHRISAPNLQRSLRWIVPDAL